MSLPRGGGGYPGQIRMVVTSPWSGLDGGIPLGKDWIGVRFLLDKVWMGVPPPARQGLHEGSRGVLAMQLAACLLRSRRRTFLFRVKFFILIPLE